MNENIPESDDTRREPPSETRRDFLANTTSVAMAGGLVAGYGTLGVMAGRYLYTQTKSPVGWVFVSRVADLGYGDSLEFTSPVGQTIVITRQEAVEENEGFIAMSNVCPHLGCKVHWEAQENHFFCPCHNGTFDPEGKGTGGPPGDAGQSLPRYPLRIENGLLMIEVPMDGVATTGQVAQADREPQSGSGAQDETHTPRGLA